MVVRDTVPAIEVLMVRRRTGASFAAGAHVFPGGAVDPSDRDPAMTPFTTGRDDREASSLLGVDSGGLGYFVAAIRECFEEAGLLFAECPGGLVSFAERTVGERYARHRSDLNAGATTLAGICQAEGLLLAVDRLRYVSHWITPVGSPRRYDTRFFVGVVPEDQVALHDDAEVVASEWVVPAEAVERHRAGELDLMLPTLKHLEFLAGFERSEDLLSAPASAVATVEPRVHVEGSDIRILFPGDPGFEDASGLPDGMAFPDLPDSPKRGLGGRCG
jgi:8-oxo-dGTP pyrophosphatase MutT (NUDIX family)